MSKTARTDESPVVLTQEQIDVVSGGSVYAPMPPWVYDPETGEMKQKSKGPLIL